MAWRLTQDNTRWHAAMADQHGRIWPFRVMHVNLVHISDPSLIVEVISDVRMDKEPWVYNSIATVRATSYAVMTCGKLRGWGAAFAIFGHVYMSIHIVLGC